MKRNPNWTTDELILALDLYFRAGRKQLDGNHPDVIELSQLLNELQIFDAEERGLDFRNPQGVAMKLGNFSALDPDYEGAGLQRGGKLDKKVWDEFSNDVQRLRLTAEAIIRGRAFLSRGDAEANGEDDVLDEPAFPEGQILTILHKRKERNRRAVDLKKVQAIKERGGLICEVCDFDFAQVYGALGSGFAECHHTVPVSSLTADHQTRLADLAILCANCHRMIHRGGLLTIEQLRSVVLRNRKDTT